MGAFRDFLQIEHDRRKKLITLFEKYQLVPHNTVGIGRTYIRWKPTQIVEAVVIERLLLYMIAILGRPKIMSTFGAYWEISDSCNLAVNKGAYLGTGTIVEERFSERI